MPKKTQRMVYARAQSVFELIDPDGHIYVLQAHDAQFPIESLAKLGEQMKQLPKGWQYRTRALTEDLVLDLGPDCYNDLYDIVPKAGKKCRKKRNL